jgi:hypothetical protein
MAGGLEHWSTLEAARCVSVREALSEYVTATALMAKGKIEFKSVRNRAITFRLAHYHRGRKMLTMMAILIGPALVAGVLIVTFFDIKATWNRNRLRQCNTSYRREAQVLSTAPTSATASLDETVPRRKFAVDTFNRKPAPRLAD